MNVPKSKRQRYRERRRKRLLAQGELFGPGYKPPFTKTPFWVDVDLHDKKQKQDTPTLGTTSEFIGMNTPIQNEVDLTDDNSPSIPIVQTTTQTEGMLHAIKKPSLNIQEKMQEKFKVNQKQYEKKEEAKNENQNKKLNEDHFKTQTEKQNEEQNKTINTKQTDMKETFKHLQNPESQSIKKSDPNNAPNKEAKTSATSDQGAKNRYKPTFQSMETETKDDNIPTPSQPKTTPTLNKPANEGNSGSQIPVLLKQPLTNKYPTTEVNVKTIPTLTNQGKKKNQSVIYQNMYNVVHPHTVNKLNTQADMQQSYAQHGYGQGMPSGIPMPSGVPMSFAMQQHNFGAIQPQQRYILNNRVPTVHVPPIQLHQPTFSQQQIHNAYMEGNFVTNPSGHVNNEVPATIPSQPYSPSDLFPDDREGANITNEEERENSSSPDICKAGQRRLSAFQRLGPLTQPKKPKLTINLSFNKEQAIREVVDENDVPQTKYVPVHMREDILSSTDDIVTTYLEHWPWKNPVVVRKSVGARVSKSAMIMEQEQMEEVYDRGNIFIQLTVKGYPNTWTKEEVLDTLLENLKGKSFVPCFIEFTPNKCKFLVLRSRPALIAIHKMGFTVRKDDVVLQIMIFDIDLDIKTINFLPTVILRKRMMLGLEDETKLNLKAFTLQPDVSHFIYYPLNRTSNQISIVDLHVSIVWGNLTHLVLSHNRITTIEGFDLQHSTPKLQYLDISHNYIERVTVLLNCRKLPLKSLKLEGNPLCTDYRDPQDYVKVARMLFPMLREIDGVAISLKNDMPTIQRNYCDGDAKDLVEKFLQTYFPILDSPPEERGLIGDMYDTHAILTLTYRSNLLNMSVYRRNRSLFIFNRKMDEKGGGRVTSSKHIVKLMKKWPRLQHDPTTFTVDVMWHTVSSTIVRIGGVMKVTSDSLAEDEHMLVFTKTILLHTTDGVEYKIRNDMLYWDMPTPEYVKHAFRRTVPLQKRSLSVTLDTPPDEDTKEYLVNIFMKLTELDRPQSERYLEEKDWNIKDALQFFTQLVKLNPGSIINNTSPSELVT